jgi:small-conductance mechanosensitive channel
MQGLISSLFGSPAAFADHARSFLVAVGLFAVALVAGWLLGLIARAIFTRAFRHRLEDLSRRLGYKQLEQSLGLRLSLATVVGWVVQIIVTAVALLLLAGIYYPAPVQTLLDTSVGYLPSLLIAFALIFVGLLLSQILADITFTGAKATKRADAAILSTAVRLGVALLFTCAALLQLGVATVFITSLLVAAFATTTLTVGLAAGLGGADYVRDVLAGRTLRAQLHPGQRVAVGDVTGVVIECGARATLIASDDGKRTLVPNKLLAEKSVVLG